MPVPNSFQQHLQLVNTAAVRPRLGEIVRGIEKESLRITPGGRLAHTPHPPRLGSALSNPYITTDYSEALLEFITPPLDRVDTLLAFLDDLHRFTYQCIDGEILWAASMPCILQGNADIPVAQYGSSNIGKMKTIYRLGLGYRYGRAMQTISGIHYNFSLSDAFWQAYQGALNDTQALQAFKNEQYLGLIRNFRRYAWLLIYLFGASPALCKSFLGERSHTLEHFDQNTLYRPGSTALRMGKLGYQSSAQEGITVTCNTLDGYIASLQELLTREHATYQKTGLRGPSGDWRQLSTTLLQIENEFYSSIRPKQPVASGEAPLIALAQRGIEYVEVRALDVNPYLPLGIDAEQVDLLDSFLLFCLLQPSPALEGDEHQQCQNNLARVVDFGRSPDLTLRQGGRERHMREWAGSILADLDQIAGLLDTGQENSPHRMAIQTQLRKLDDPGLTPSGRIMTDMANGEIPWFHFAMNQSRAHDEYFRRRPPGDERSAFFQEAAALSLEAQARVERESGPDFDEFLRHYYQQYEAILGKPS